MNVAQGRVVYTAMLNERGTFESDLTVIRLEAEKFLLVTGSTQQVRDSDWLATTGNRGSHEPRGAHGHTCGDRRDGAALARSAGPGSR
jgi:4-methylaminobutanoate oxidase (formaldehyde-forming)